jgi:hypothetical protein
MLLLLLLLLSTKQHSSRKDFRWYEGVVDGGRRHIPQMERVDGAARIWTTHEDRSLADNACLGRSWACGGGRTGSYIASKQRASRDLGLVGDISTTMVL